jgi:hypothetical protein
MPKPTVALAPYSRRFWLADLQGRPTEKAVDGRKLGQRSGSQGSSLPDGRLHFSPRRRAGLGSRDFGGQREQRHGKAFFSGRALHPWACTMRRNSAGGSCRGCEKVAVHEVPLPFHLQAESPRRPVTLFHRDITDLGVHPPGQAASSLVGSSLLSRDEAVITGRSWNQGKNRKGEKQVSDFREPDPCSDGGISEGSINLEQQYRVR